MGLVNKHKRPELTIIIVNSDGLLDTLNCLDSIYKNPPGFSFEVILVDNHSQDGCISIVNKLYPELMTFESPNRQGFAKNYNLGLSKGSGDFLLVLNNDTLIHSGTLDTLVAFIKNDHSYGMVGPQLRSQDGQIQTVCARELITPLQYILIQLFLDLGHPAGRVIDRFRQKKLRNLQSGPVPCISGACTLVSRQAIEQVGYLDEGYDFYYEDVEWCHRMHIHEYQVGYVREAVVTHLGDQSLSKVKEWAKRSEYKSALRYFRQYHGLTEMKQFLIWLVTLFSYFLRAALFSLSEIFTGKQSCGPAYRQLTYWIAIEGRKQKAKDEQPLIQKTITAKS